jgi:hypothetical protein
VRVVEHPQDDVVDPGLAPGDEQLERLAAALLDVPDEVLVVGLSRRVSASGLGDVGRAIT